jgi:hypothetical protein
MKTYYTIIKISHNPISNDTLSIGLLVRDCNKLWIKFSEDKKSIAKRLLNTKAATIDFICNQIENSINNYNKEIEIINLKPDKQLALEGITNLIGLLFSKEKILQKKNDFNGVVRFTDPIEIYDEMNEIKFDKLYELIIEKPSTQNSIEIFVNNDFKLKIQDNLINRVANKVHTNVSLNPNNIKGLYYKFNMDCIGLNGSFIGAKSISFDRTYTAIDKDLSHYLSLITLLDAYYSREKKDNFFIISDEPSVIDSKEHETWENIQKNPAIHLINSDQVSVVAELIEEKKATKFIPDSIL